MSRRATFWKGAALGALLVLLAIAGLAAGLWAGGRFFPPAPPEPVFDHGIRRG